MIGRKIVSCTTENARIKGTNPSIRLPGNKQIGYPKEQPSKRRFPEKSGKRLVPEEFDLTSS
jgi:hypothetical protein